MNEDKFTIESLGDSALLISFENVINEAVNSQVLTLYEKIKSCKLKGVTDLVPAYSTLTIHYNVLLIEQEISKGKTVFEYLSLEIKRLIKDDEVFFIQNKSIRIPVCYADKFALDIYEISKQKGISRDEIVDIHTAKIYRVFMIGFLPGFPYMGEVDKRISVNRKDQPRMKIPAGSVGIAGMQTGIYPVDSPGGWQIIGKTPVGLFNKNAADRALLKPGDEVEFYSISENEFANY